MTLREHYWKMFWEISMFCGFIILVLTVYMQFNGMVSVARRTLWQIILLGATIVFRGESLINFHGLPDHTMRLNYIISSVLADATLIILLYWFTPGGKFFSGSAWTILAIYVIAKGLIYLMVYFQALQSAKEINVRLKKTNIQ